MPILRSLLNGLFSGSGTTSCSKTCARLGCEQLGERIVPAVRVYTVNVSNDMPAHVDGLGKFTPFVDVNETMISLRSIVQFSTENVETGAFAQNHYQITFAETLGTITLGVGLPDLTSNFNFIGNGVTIERDPNAVGFFRHFAVKPNTETHITVASFRYGLSASPGGSIENEGKLIIDGCSFSNNEATNAGGAIASAGDATLLTIQNSSFWYNSARSGGAISAGQKTNLTITATDIFANQATGGDENFEGHGGGLLVYVDEGSATINQNTRIYGNSAAKHGGGIYVLDSSLTMNGGELDGNSAGAYGGGIEIDAAGKTITLTDMAVTDNSAGVKGGGVSIWKGTLTGKLSALTGNTAEGIPGVGYKKDQATANELTVPKNQQTKEEDP